MPTAAQIPAGQSPSPPCCHITQGLATNKPMSCLEAPCGSAGADMAPSLQQSCSRTVCHRGMRAQLNTGAQGFDWSISRSGRRCGLRVPTAVHTARNEVASGPNRTTQMPRWGRPYRRPRQPRNTIAEARARHRSRGWLHHSPDSRQALRSCGDCVRLEPLENDTSTPGRDLQHRHPRENDGVGQAKHRPNPGPRPHPWANLWLAELRADQGRPACAQHRGVPRFLCFRVFLLPLGRQTLARRVDIRTSRRPACKQRCHPGRDCEKRERILNPRTRRCATLKTAT